MIPRRNTTMTYPFSTEHFSALTGLAGRLTRVSLRQQREGTMGLILLVLLLALLFGGLGFAIHALWIVAVIVFIAWLLGFALRGASGSRWYRW
jgi:hypothetical protein